MIQILIVDDNLNMRDVLAETLQSSLSVVVRTAGSGNAAIEMLSKGEQFSLIISDYSMPDGNGVELLEFVTVHSPTTFFILFSGESKLNVSVENKFFLGVESKPNVESLVKKVKLALCMAPAYFKNIYP